MGCTISTTNNAPHSPRQEDAPPLPPQTRQSFVGVVNGLLSDLPKRRRRGGSLSDPDISLAGYLLSKAVIGDPVEPQDIPRLHKANNTMQETRARFPYGRGNVATDIAVSDHASSQHAQAAHDVFVDLLRAAPPASMLTNPTLGHAVVSEFVQGGHCAGYAAVATMRHVQKLQPEESVHYVQHNHQGHDWAESRVPDGHHKTIVLDPWAQGPAVFASDSRFAANAQHTQERLALNAKDGDDIAAKTAAGAQYLLENCLPLTETHLKRLKAQEFHCAPEEVWQPQPVVSDAFRRRVRQSLATLTNSSELGLSRAEQSSKALKKMSIKSACALGFGKKAASAAAEGIAAAAYQLCEQSQ
ncbi:avirulence protein [Xanthomonas phaseoli pv. phaseoli]|uniref:type III secretion system effector avirulence protein AvrXacE2 n=1 Tax=Xanthomonas phaseoli TaxID=1985254 RepID=UPI00053748AC|nr:type III secretion system effector avirulence protein AvrXacE2 [Xanthomonas phaseoli]KGU51624.1 avirulence protein [Xanthomonas phaseoli pv. phaseoli]KHF47420.1 avirulence protein [Xanthomonas phaseoli pv. phaseoli]KHS21145.1 avirulence protein [Xanthomonas phaseoli pv. phaseoli]